MASGKVAWRDFFFLNRATGGRGWERSSEGCNWSREARRGEHCWIPTVAQSLSPVSDFHGSHLCWSKICRQSFFQWRKIFLPFHPSLLFSLSLSATSRCSSMLIDHEYQIPVRSTEPRLAQHGGEEEGRCLRAWQRERGAGERNRSISDVCKDGYVLAQTDKQHV